MTTRSAPAIVYPETDGMPLPDGEYQAPLYISILGTLRTHFGDVPGARVNGDTFIYYVEGNSRRSVSPDCYVVFGLSEAALESLSLEGNNTYLLWEVGKPPDFILEIGSSSTARTDLGSKRDLYAELGVGNTGGMTGLVVSSTASHWLGSAWWVESIGGWKCGGRMTVGCGRTARR